MLNWRRDPDYERRMSEKLSDIERSKERTKQIENELAQLQRENVREKALSALIRQRCFPPESSSIPPPPIKSD